MTKKTRETMGQLSRSLTTLLPEQVEILQKLSPEESARSLLYLQKISVQKDPFALIEGGHLTIKTKSAKMVPLTLNKAQARLHNIIKHLWTSGKIIRLLILKARQLGISTYVEALIYAITSQTQNINATIIADDLDGSNYIFEMSKLYHEKLAENLRTPTKRSNEKKLEFDKIHSQILIDTAENEDAGRKYTFRLVHLSEYAFFTKSDRLMLGLNQAVPALPQTIIIKETTANGFNFFRDEWDRAEAGDIDWLPIFVPWYWGEEYQMPVDESFVIADPAYGETAKEEFKLRDQMQKEGIDHINERLQWRRWCIRNNCDNSVTNFQQEYPSTPEEAFIASGECFFDKNILAEQYRQAGDPLFRADIVRIDYDYQLRVSDDGQFEFYERPDPATKKFYHQYCIGGDACSGSGQDWAVLVARRKDTNTITATFRGKIDPDELAFKASLLGGYLNQATVAIENDKFGFAANQKLKQIYPKIFYQQVVNKATKAVTERFGWETNQVTRPMMLGQMQAEIRENALLLKSRTLIKECLTFIKNPDTKKAEAQEGCNDDFVMACAISGAVRQMDPYKPPRDKKPGVALTARPRNAGMTFKKRS